ncbi:MAG: hypothetical protein IPM64_03695 [Phycisphaerales bacterium]|nr:hypothetical protein [Phycisphaerales bacterium]
MSMIQSASSASAAGQFGWSRATLRRSPGALHSTGPPTAASGSLDPPTEGRPSAAESQPDAGVAAPAVTAWPSVFTPGRAVLSLLTTSAESFRRILSVTGDARYARAATGFHVDVTA